MQLHQLRKFHKPKKKRQRRGGKKGTYSGRGMKGQKARAGRKLQPAIRELIKRYSKLRGYRSKRIKSNIAIVTLPILEKLFEPGQVVEPKVLLEKRLVRRIKGRLPKIKLLAKGKLTKPFEIKGFLVSKGAREAIEKAGGRIS